MTDFVCPALINGSYKSSKNNDSGMTNLDFSINVVAIFLIPLSRILFDWAALYDFNTFLFLYINLRMSTSVFLNRMSSSSNNVMVI